MPRPRHILRPVTIKTNLPEDLRARLDLHLFSELESRVPHGAYSRFLSERISEFFEFAALDLSSWLDPSGPPMIVRGPARAIDALAIHMKEHRKC